MPTPRAALLATALASLPIAAGAQPVAGLYIAGGAGFNLLEERDFDARGGNRTYFQGLPASPAGEMRTEGGYVGVLSLGFGFGNGLRLEAEGNFRRNELDRVNGFGSPTITRSFRANGGDVTQYGVMGNVLFDVAIPGFPVVPYVGGGAGYVWSDVDIRATRDTPTGNTIRVDDTKGRFAYQGIVGAALPVAFAPGLTVTLEYRYLGVVEGDNYRYGGRVTNPAGGLVSTGTYRLDDASNHSILIGARYAFGAPRPAPAPAPAPAVAPQVARTYLVFFDWDRADLTDRARQIVAEAANTSRTSDVTRIEVAGHADRSGTPQYNQRLSQRRAEVVAAELARNGVARGSISISAFGESRPLVPTADGVREPQNRRVEIVLR